MTDPRIKQTEGTKAVMDATYWAAAFDRADKEAGIVRVDTRDSATRNRIAAALDMALGNDSGQGEHLAGVVLAAFTEESL